MCPFKLALKLHILNDNVTFDNDFHLKKKINLPKFVSVACSTVTVTKCQAALRTLQAFPFFKPTCLCREPHVDPECSSFRDFLFDHPCLFVIKKGEPPRPCAPAPSCSSCSLGAPFFIDSRRRPVLRTAAKQIDVRVVMERRGGPDADAPTGRRLIPEVFNSGTFFRDADARVSVGRGREWNRRLCGA